MNWVRRWLSILGRGLLVVGFVVTLVSGLGGVHAVFELLTNFRTALFVVGVLGLPAFAFKRPYLAGMGLAMVVINGLPILAILGSSPDPVEANATAEVLQFNIWFGNTDFEAIADVINSSDADVVAVHELTESQWAGIAPLLVEYPHSVEVPVRDELGPNGGGMALLSRTAIREVDVDDTWTTPERPILAIETLVGGKMVTVVGLHPQASRFEGEKVELRNRQLETVARVVGASELPAIVMTDLNITPFSPDYDRFLDELDWRDPHEVVGFHATWPAGAGSLGVPIDHIFVSDNVRLHAYRTGDGAGSDHRTLTATVSIDTR